MTNNDETNYYAGPFCTCGDYSCPASDEPNANCINSEHPGDCAGGVIVDEDGSRPKTQLPAICYARGRGTWHHTYAQAQADPRTHDQQEPEPLHCTDEQIAALRAALKAR